VFTHAHVSMITHRVGVYRSRPIGASLLTTSPQQGCLALKGLHTGLAGRGDGCPLIQMSNGGFVVHAMYGRVAQRLFQGLTFGSEVVDLTVLRLRSVKFPQFHSSMQRYSNPRYSCTCFRSVNFVRLLYFTSRSIAMSVSVCLSVCSVAYLKNHTSELA